MKFDKDKPGLTSESRDHFSEISGIFLDRRLALTPREYQILERELLAFLLCEEATFEKRLIGGAAWLGILRDFLLATAPAASQDPDKRTEILDTFFQSMKQNGYERPLRIASKPVGASSLQRMLLGLILAFRRKPEKQRANILTALFIFYHYAKTLFRMGRIRMPGLEASFPFSSFRKIPMNPSSEPLKALLEDWASQFIKQGKLQRSKTIREGYLYLLLNYALIRWYATGITWQEKAESIGEKQVKRSIELAKEYFPFPGVFDELFQYNPILENVIQNSFTRKTAPQSFVHPPVG